MQLVLGGAIVLAPAASPALPGARAATLAPATISIGVLDLPRALNPLLDPLVPTADVTDGIFDSLLSVDTHDVLQPDLATRYTVGQQGIRYQFSLNPRAHWQDGIPVTADDVLFTAKLMRDRRFPAYNRFGFGNIATLPYAPFLRAFATTPLLPAHVLSPIPIDQIARYDTFNRRPIGTGPYAVSEYQDGDHITLTANSSYFRGAPHLQQVIFRRESSEAAALAALRTGAVQMLAPSVGVTPQHLLASLQSGRLTAFAAPGFGWAHIDLIESGFLRDHLVRQALAYATPRQHIVSTLFSGLVTMADADQPPTSQYYEPAVAGSYPYDPAHTAALLTKQGYKRHHGRWTRYGRVLQIALWTDAGCDACLRAGRMVAESWTAAGIPTTLRTLKTHALFGTHGPLYGSSRLFNPALNAVLYTWATSPEPDDSYYWSTSMIVRPGHLAGGNFDGYSDPRVDRLEVQALTAPDEATRVSLYRAIQLLLVRDQPDIFLYWTAHLSLAVSSLHGYEANPFHPGVTWNVARWQVG
jgi:peptide/nickel transport system substrate-binding protein